MENRKPGRTFFGKIVKFAFIAFNLLMGFWMVAGINSAGSMEAANEAEQAGQAIGAGAGLMIILFIWMCGAVIGGFAMLLTRPK